MLAGIIRPQSFPDLPSDWEVQGRPWISPVDGLELFETIFSKKDLPAQKRVLASVHGGGEHSGRYQHFAHFLKSEFDCIVALDLRGHGRSKGTRGYVAAFDEHTSDVLAWWDHLLPLTGGGSLSAFGHSLGGLITLRALKAKPGLNLSSVVVSAPLLGFSMAVPLIKKVVGRALSQVWPDLQLGSGIPTESISRDPNLIKAHHEDRLIHGKATPRLYTEILKAIDDTVGWSGPAGGTFPIPMMFIIPLADGIVNASNNQAFAKAFRATKKVVHEYPGMFHESFNDLGKEKVFEDLQTWFRDMA